MVSTLARGRTSPVWLVAMATAGLGGLSALLAFWPAAHLPESVLGALCVPLGALAQMLSETTNQRWLAICGVVAGGFGLAIGIGNGGFA